MVDRNREAPTTVAEAVRHGIARAVPFGSVVLVGAVAVAAGEVASAVAASLLGPVAVLPVMFASCWALATLVVKRDVDGTLERLLLRWILGPHASSGVERDR
jgi:hypothetical protein